MKTETIGHQVRLARGDLGWTQRILANQADTDQSTISAVESGAMIPGRDLAQRIASALHGYIVIDDHGIRLVLPDVSGVDK